MKIINILVCCLSILLLGCESKIDFRNDFQKIVIDYQKTFPLPSDAKIKENHPNSKPIYTYNVYFKKEKNDTIFEIARYSSGITKKFTGYGVYDKNVLPTFVTDDGNLSGKVIINKVKNNNLNKFIGNQDDFLEGFTPIYVYKIKNDNISLVRIDTVWKNWD